MFRYFLRKLFFISNLAFLTFTGILSCAPTLFPIGGTVSGLSGSLVLQNNGGDNLSLTADGAFTFSTGLALESAYSITVLTQPSGQTCTVTNGEGTVTGTVSDIIVTCSSSDETFTLGGTISGLMGTVVLENSDAQELSVSSDGAFVFVTALANGAPYAVTVKTQPENPHQICVVTNGSGTVNGENVTNISVSCTENLYTVTIDLQTLEPLQVGSSSLVIALEDGGTDLVFANTGTQTFENSLPDGVYALTITGSPTIPHQTCTLMGADFAGGSVTLNGANITVNANCSINDYSLSVNVTGLGDGETLTAASTVGGVLPVIVGNGTATFPDDIADQTAYTVSISQQPTTQTCTLGSNASGTINGADVEVDVTCVNTYTVGGTISGLSGTVVLQNNGGNNLSTSSNGAFTFSQSLEEGAAYSVTILTQPSGQICDVSNGSGTVATSNVSNVSVVCIDVLRVFLTNGNYVPGASGLFAFDSVAAADAKCMSDFNYPGSGTYRALLVDGSTRIACTTPNCTTPEGTDWVLQASTTYIRIDSSVVTTIGETNGGGVFEFPLDNTLAQFSSATPWTGLNADWTTGDTCTAWASGSVADMGVRGDSGVVTSSSIFFGPWFCNSFNNFFCVEQP